MMSSAELDDQGRLHVRFGDIEEIGQEYMALTTCPYRDSRRI
jgi:hypothetical protein